MRGLVITYQGGIPDENQSLFPVLTRPDVPRAARQRQRCVNGDWPCQWEMAIFDPHRIQTPLTDNQKIGESDYGGGLYGCVKFGANPCMGASVQMGEI